jgi:3-hydroxy-D-aspartate aldolase
MTNKSVSIPKRSPAWASTLPQDIQTPCFMIYEKGIVDNLHATARACGGVHRLMPHVKTHRASWIVELLLKEGVRAFKASTVAEVTMVLAAGAPYVVWAYPSANPANIRAVIDAAGNHPGASVAALVDSAHGLEVWRKVFEACDSDISNVKLIVDLDPGMGRTGAPISQVAINLAGNIHTLNLFGGFHVYDGHIQGDDAAVRQIRIGAVIQQVAELMDGAASAGLSTELIAGGSYSFDVWPDSLAKFVGPGSWTFSSDQHDAELPGLGWQPSAYVLATVIATKGDTATLDAGSKAISPDKPLSQRFRWDRKILMMSEEHVVVENDGLKVGERVLLMPRHACTTAYLYDKALVIDQDGEWSFREQLGNHR